MEDGMTGSQKSLGEEELRVIASQLSRKPRGVLSVERRCRFGYPQVIKVYPLLRDGAGRACPFPTLFWLTCPTLIERLSRLEHQGYIKELERKLAEDGRLREEYYQNHRDYIAERWAALTPEDRALAAEKGLDKALRGRGIGGLADWDKVKCLHLHYAHHLARGNAIGRWVEDRFSLKECGPERIICGEF